MTTENQSREPDTDAKHSRSGYDPHQFVPDQTDGTTASGLAQLHKALSPENARKLATAPLTVQANLLWTLVDSGVIEVNVTTQYQ